MHDDDFNYQSDNGQGRADVVGLARELSGLSSAEFEAMVDLVTLLGMPATPATDALIVVFWLNLRGRLSPEEYKRFIMWMGV